MTPFAALACASAAGWKPPGPSYWVFCKGHPPLANAGGSGDVRSVGVLLEAQETSVIYIIPAMRPDLNGGPDRKKLVSPIQIILPRFV